MQTTLNTTIMIEEEIISTFIQTNLRDGLLPGEFYRDVTAQFQHGESLKIPSIGEVTLQEAAEDTPLVYNPIETGAIYFRITDYLGDAWYITDDLREDGSPMLISQLIAERSAATTRAIQEVFETRLLEAANDAQNQNTKNTINGYDHRLVGSGASNITALADFVKMQLVFTKTNVPQARRVAIVDPTVYYHLMSSVNFAMDITENGMEFIKGGAGPESSYLGVLAGWHTVTSNRLKKGSLTDGTTTVSTGVANVFMSILDDSTKPLLAAWRRQPVTRGEYNKDLSRTEYVTKCRFGVGSQRVDTLGILITKEAMS